MNTIRELFHNLGNKHNLISVGCGVAQETAEDCLKDKKASPELKKGLLEIIGYLKRLIKDAQEADKITTEIHDRIYKIIDPDSGKPRQGGGRESKKKG